MCNCKKSQGVQLQKMAIQSGKNYEVVSKTADLLFLTCLKSFNAPSATQCSQRPCPSHHLFGVGKINASAWKKQANPVIGLFRVNLLGLNDP